MSEPAIARVPTREWEQKRLAILRSAAEVFYTYGFERGTGKQIAELVGLSQPSIYHYVGAKQDLLGEISLEVARDFMSSLERALATGGEPAERLRVVIHEITAAIIRNRKAYAVYMHERGAIPVEVERRVTRDEQTFTMRIEEVVQEVVAAGGLPVRRPPEVLTRAIVGMVRDVYVWYDDYPNLTPEAVADSFCDLIGLGANR